MKLSSIVHPHPAPTQPQPSKLDRAAKALPEASRRAEDHLRQAFFAEVGTVLACLGAAPALRAPKQLQGDAGVCLRYNILRSILYIHTLPVVLLYIRRLCVVFFAVGAAGRALTLAIRQKLQQWWPVWGTDTVKQ